LKFTISNDKSEPLYGKQSTGLWWNLNSGSFCYNMHINFKRPLFQDQRIQ
jgi:hypothetical protein